MIPDGQIYKYYKLAAIILDRFCISGPLIHYFYDYLDKFVPKTASYSKAKRLLIDRGVMSPMLLFVFFYVVAILEVSVGDTSRLSSHSRYRFIFFF